MSKYGNATGSLFRLSICLKRFYSDERKRCYVLVHGGLRVCWLARRLRRLFGLRGPFCLLSSGHLLPPDESLRLLAPDDLVEAIPKPYRIFEDTSDSGEDEHIKPIENNTVPSDSVGQHENIILNSAERKGNYEKEDDVQISGIIKTDGNSVAAQVKNCRENLKQNNVTRTDLQKTTNNEHNTDTENKLMEVKRKALQLLDQCSIPSKRKRKRVRRRKLQADSTDTTAASCGPHSDDEHPTLSPTPPHPAPLELDAEANVVNNDTDRSAASTTPILRNNILQIGQSARLVYSLYS